MVNKIKEVEIELSPEIWEKLYEKINHLHDEKYDDMDSIYRRIKEEAEDISNGQLTILKRLSAIESLIHNHSIGVTNIYNKFIELEKRMASDEVSKLLRTLQKFDIEQIKNSIEELRRFMNSEGVNDIINKFSDFKESIIEVLEIGKGIK